MPNSIIKAPDATDPVIFLSKEVCIEELCDDLDLVDGYYLDIDGQVEISVEEI